MISESNPMLQAALELELPVLPLHSIVDGACTCDAGRLCGSPGKHPLTERGAKDATRNHQTIRRWWTEAPTANIGVATGESGLFVVGPDGQKGLDALAELERCHGPLPITPRARTGGG